MTYLERTMPADVPLQRGSVGAMEVPGGFTDLHRPYVYRGLGFDVFDIPDEFRPSPRPAPVKPKPVAKPVAKPEPRVETDEERADRLADENFRILLAEKRKRKAQKRLRKKRREFPETPAAPDPVQPRPARASRYAHASATPISVDDIEDLLRDD